MASTIASHRGATFLSLVYGKWFLLALFLFHSSCSCHSFGHFPRGSHLLSECLTGPFRSHCYLRVLSDAWRVFGAWLINFH